MDRETLAIVAQIKSESEREEETKQVGNRNESHIVVFCLMNAIFARNSTPAICIR